jgi:hypothetical protein
MRAVTTAEISGACIPTIPAGTEFEIVRVLEKYKYATCKGLPVFSIRLDEFEIIGSDPPKLRCKEQTRNKPLR